MGKKRMLAIAMTICMMFSILMPQNTWGGAQSKEATSETDVNVIDATEYGADPTGMEDSAGAIRDAIAAAKKKDGPVTISFPKGEYHIYPDTIEERELYVSNTVGTDQSNKMKKIGFLFEDMHDVTVEGNGSLFMFHGKMTTYATINSENIKFQNFSFDFRTPTVIDVTVESTDGNTATMYVPECYDYSVSGTTVTWKSDVSPYTGERYWTTTNGMNYKQVFDIKTGRTTRSGSGLFDSVTAIADIGNHRLKFTYSSRPNDIVAGKCYQMRPTVRDHAGMFFWKSKNVTLKDINAHFLHGFGIVGQSSENITLDHVILETPEGSGRTTAGYADFIQMSGCKGKVTVQNCSFSNPHDDPINVHGTFNLVKETNVDGDARKVTVRFEHNETAGFPNFFVGDMVRFLKKSNATCVQDGAEEWRATVVAVDGPDGEGGQNSRADSLVEGLRRTTLTLDKDIPEEVVIDNYVIEDVTYTPDVLIQNNVFKETPTRGILVKTKGKVEIKDNTFDGLDMYSIQIEEMMGWYESGPVEDVTIEGNTFIRPATPVIRIDPDGAVDKTTPVHKNIKILNNTFYMNNGQILSVKNTSGLTITGNKIYRYDPKVTVTIAGSGDTNLQVGETEKLTATAAADARDANGNAYNSNLYNIEGCTNVKISGNTYDGGLKLGGSKSGDMTNADIENGDGIAFGGTATTLSTVGKVAYESGDSEVLTVNESGQVKAVGAGTAKVRAYTVVCGRKFVSDWREFTVTDGSEEVGEASLSVSAASGIRVTNEYGKTIQYSATDAQGQPVSGVTWSVVDADTHGETDRATISENGLLTTVSDGAVGIIATKDGLQAREVLVINKGGEKLLGNGVAIYDNEQHQYGEDSTKWKLTADNAIEITAQGSGIYNEQTTKNIFMTKDAFSKDNTTAVIKLSGDTANTWDDVGMLIGYDVDNYVSIGRKYRDSGKKITMVKEMNGANQGEHWKTYTDSGDLYLKLQKAGTAITGFYSADGINWTKFTSVNDDDGQGDFSSGEFDFSGQMDADVKVGFYAARSAVKYTFSDLKVTTGTGESAVTKQIPLAFDNEAPKVEGVSCTYANGTLTMSKGTFSDPNEGDTEGESIVKWMVSDTEDGVYKFVPELLHETTVSAPATWADKWVKALVIPQDSHGLYGTPAESKNPAHVGAEVAKQPASISISAGKRVTAEHDEEIQYNAVIAPEGATTVVSWSVVDAVTKNATTCAQIDAAGNLTTKSNGAVEVIARTSNGLEARELLVINKDELVLAHDIKIAEEEEKAKWSMPRDGVISLETAVGGLWNTQTPKPKNWFFYTLDNAENVTATIKMKGRTAYDYEEAGLVFFVDNSKYVFVGRKHAGSNDNRRIRLVTWAGSGDPDESQAYGSQVSANPVYLKLIKEGNSFTAFWSADKTDWKAVGNAITNASLGNQFKVGFFAGKNQTSQSDVTFEFSELEIDGDGTQFPLTSMNRAPVAKNVTCAYDSETKQVSADYLFEDTDGGMDDTEETSLIRWMAADTEEGPFEFVEDVSDLAGKWARAVVIPQDIHGLYGAPAIAETAVKVEEIAETAVPSSDSALRSASITGAGSFGTFSSGTKNYITTAGKDVTSVTASFAVRDVQIAEGKEAATVEVTLNGTSYAKGQSSVSGLPLPLVSGINVIRAIVTAEDGKTKTEYRFAIIKTGDSNADASSITLNDQALAGFAANKTEYEYQAQEGATSLKVAAETASEGAGAKIVAGGQIINGKEATIDLQPGRNDVTIFITPETKFPQKKYHITVYKPSTSNAYLKALSFSNEVTLNSQFDRDKTSYIGSAAAKEAKISLLAEEAGAKIELIQNGQTVAEVTNGSMEQQAVPFVNGSNRMQIKVTAPDGEITKTYALKLSAWKEVKLSSLSWDTASNVGWGSIHKNESTGGNSITLRGEDGTIKTYESGIGGHATMNLIYNIDPQAGYKKFVTWIGVDQEANNEASMTFAIHLNDSQTPAWTSGDDVVRVTTPAKKAEINMAGVTKIKIVADKTSDGDSNDHVSLGDAKFLMPLDGVTDAFYDVEYRSEPADAVTITATAGDGANALSGDGYIRVAAGSDVTLTAAQASGHEDDVFAGWYDEAGNLLSDQLSCTVTDLQDDAVCIAKMKSSLQAELEAKIQEMEDKYTDEELAKYTAESVAEYRKALKAAKDALADKDKTDEKIQKALADLEAVVLVACACEIGELAVSDQTVEMAAGQATATVQLNAQATVTGTCQADGHPEGNAVSYRYKVTDAGKTQAAVNASGLVTVRRAGTATVTVTAELASGAEGKRTASKTVTIHVIRPATVTFNANGGVFENGQTTKSDVADENGHVNAPSKAPEKSGYAFKGWQKEDGSAYNFDTDTADDDLTLVARWTERTASKTLDSAKDFSIGSYSNTASGESYRILIVNRETNTGGIGENHLLGKADTKPTDNKIALLQFDLSGYAAEEGKTLESVMLRLCMAGSRETLTNNQLRVCAIPAESGITDLTKAPSEQGVTPGAGESLPASWSWNAVKAVLDKWNPGTGQAKDFVAAGLSNPYSRTGAAVNMDIRNQKGAALDKTAYYVDITDAVQDALAAETKTLILAVNETKNIEHYFISSIGAKGQGSTEKYDNADETMAPSLQFFYEGDNQEKCSCTLGNIVIDDLTLTAGESANLAPNAPIHRFECAQHTSEDADRVTYGYEVTKGNAVTVDESGMVTAGKVGTAEIKITATLDNDSSETKEKFVKVTVKRDMTSSEKWTFIRAEQDFCIKGYSSDKGTSYTDRPVLVVRNQKFDDADFGSVGEGMLVSGQTPDDPAMSLLQFDFSDMTNEEKETLQTAKLRLYLAGSYEASTGNTLKAAVVPAESGLTDISDKTNWNAVSGAVGDWLSNSQNRFTPAGESAPYNTGSGKDMAHPELGNPPVSVEIDITQAVKDALTSESAGKFILAINETKGAQHYFVRSDGASGSGKITGATEEMAPAILFTYKDDEPDGFTVTFNKNAGSDNDKVTGMPETKENVTELQKPTETPDRGEDFTFKGWSLTSDGDVIAEEEWPLPITEITELFAIWEPAEPAGTTCRVTFNPNAGRDNDKVTDMPDDMEDVAKDTPIDKPAKEPKRDGYTFKGWSLTSDGDVIAEEEWPQTITKETIFFAIWEPDGGSEIKDDEADEAIRTAVEKAKEFYSEKNDYYPDDTWNKFIAAYKAATGSMEGLTAAQRKKLADDLEKAMQDLEFSTEKVASTVEGALKADKGYIDGGNPNFTSKTWDAYKKAYDDLAKAKAGGAGDDELVRLRKALAEAKKGLTPDNVWEGAKNALTAELGTSKKIYAAGGSKYTDDTWNAFKRAYEAALLMEKAIAGNSSKEKLQALKSDLETARKALKQKTVPAPTPTVPKLAKGVYEDKGGIRYTVIDPDKKTVNAAGVASWKKKLKTVKIPATVSVKGVTCTVTEIKASGFKKFAQIKTVTIGKKVTKIGKNAFNGCKAMTKLTVSGDVKTFESQAFGGCKKLRTINFKGKKVPAFKKKAFKGTPAKMTVKLSKALKKSNNKKKMTSKLRSAGISKKSKIK